MCPDPESGHDIRAFRHRRQAKERQIVSLYTVVSRGLVGRLGQHPDEPGAVAESVAGSEPAVADNPAVWLQGASMRLLEAGLALTAIATAFLIGVGR
jgi:hypothetical protein